MILPDVNLILYAEVQQYPRHLAAKAWWEGLLNGGDVGLCSPVIFGFVRIATHTKILASPMPIDDALGRVESWLARPRVRRIDPGPRHEELAFALLRTCGAAGNLTTDAQIAALALEHGAEVHTADADFARFPGVRWKNPLHARHKP